MIKPENILSIEELRDLGDRYAYEYEAGEFAEGMPERLQKFIDGDGGILNLIDLAIHYATERDQMRADRDEAVGLLKYALHLRRRGESALGGNETWQEFDDRNEAFLSALLDREMKSRKSGSGNQ
jgi:hypothetical protein